RHVELPRPLLPARGRGAGGVLHRGPWGVHWFSLVQREARAGVHGRHRIAGAGRRDGGGRHAAQVRVPVRVHRRRLCRRDGVGPHPADRVQVPPSPLRRRVCESEPRVSPGAAAPPLRAEGLAGVAGRGAVLDHRGPLCIRGARHDEAAVTRVAPPTSGSREAGAARFAAGEVAVIGLARSGVAAAQLAAREGARVYASDAAPRPGGDTGAPGGTLDRLAVMGIDAHWGGHNLDRIARAALVVVSPGVPPDAAPVMAARRASVPVVSEVELALWFLPSTRIIAVTGTNGKSTV